MFDLTRMSLRLSIAGLIAASAAAAHGEPARCSQIMQEIDRLVAFANETADAYWERRSAFVDLLIKKKHETPEAKEIESAAQLLQKGMQPNWEKLKSALEEAQTQNCKPTGELDAIRETIFAKTKSVNFDRFPKEE